MKAIKQTFLVSMLTDEGTQKDFYRFAYKKAETCKNALIKASKTHSIFPTCWKADKITKIVCYSTPDGYNKSNIAWECSLDEILEGSKQ